MTEIVIHRERMTEALAKQLAALCPFQALWVDGGELKLDAGGCRMCGLCVRGSGGALEWKEEAQLAVDKDVWRGIAVYAEQFGGKLHGVGLELLSQARELAKVTGHPVYALLAGSGLDEAAETLLQYGADVVYRYDCPELREFQVDVYTAVLEDFIHKVRPSAVLVGATVQGRSLAPRAAARFRTGLTADCTKLEMKENTDLVQIRPAFGGNIMAEIVTPRTRPQFCTVRHKIFEARRPEGRERGRVERMELSAPLLRSGIRVLEVYDKPSEVDLTEADVILAVGRGLKSQGDLELIRWLGKRIGAQLACTRPLVECGWFDGRRQIGLSGRTVNAKVIVTLGISGSVQFAAGMRSCDRIVAVNRDPSAPIFDIADDGFVADLYEVLPELVKCLGEETTDVS